MSNISGSILTDDGTNEIVDVEFDDEITTITEESNGSKDDLGGEKDTKSRSRKRKKDEQNLEKRAKDNNGNASVTTTTVEAQVSPNSFKEFKGKSGKAHNLRPLSLYIIEHGGRLKGLVARWGGKIVSEPDSADIVVVENGRESDVQVLTSIKNDQLVLSERVFDSPDTRFVYEDLLDSTHRIYYDSANPCLSAIKKTLEYSEMPSEILYERCVRRNQERILSMWGQEKEEGDYDTILVSNDKCKFYGYKCLLSVNSRYFKHLFEKHLETTMFGVPLSKNSLSILLRFYLTGELVMTSIMDLRELAVFANQIQEEELHVLCLSTMLRYLKTHDHYNTLADLLFGAYHQTLTVALLPYICRHAKHIFHHTVLATFDLELWKHLLTVDLGMPEHDLVHRIIMWAICHSTRVPERLQLCEELRLDASAKVLTASFVLADKMEISFHKNNTEVRKQIEPLLHLIHFEKLPPNVLRMLHQLEIFSAQEEIELKNSLTAPAEFKLFNVSYPTKRSRRRLSSYTGHQVDNGPNNSALRVRYKVSAADVQPEKHFLEEFHFCNSSWFLCIQEYSGYLSIYLYNKNIYEGLPLDHPIHLRTRFTLLNHIDSQYHRITMFDKAWDDVSAYGCKHFIKKEYLMKNNQGWLSSEGDLVLILDIQQLPPSE